ncbi:uncharacterized protein DS421_17g575840 [Arachis hypogaea]|nr:uncharacterized protein DS421_17g575840 [Arachis hypogaea]
MWPVTDLKYLQIRPMKSRLILMVSTFGEKLYTLRKYFPSIRQMVPGCIPRRIHGRIGPFRNRGDSEEQMVADLGNRGLQSYDDHRGGGYEWGRDLDYLGTKTPRDKEEEFRCFDEGDYPWDAH